MPRLQYLTHYVSPRAYGYGSFELSVAMKWLVWRTANLTVSWLAEVPPPIRQLPGSPVSRALHCLVDTRGRFATIPPDVSKNRGFRVRVVDGRSS